MSRKFFGTDGIRTKAGAYPLTPEFCVKLGWAIGKQLQDQGLGMRHVIIGKDSRISGYMLEYALTSGLVSAGIDVHLLGVMPTPSIAYFTKTFHAAAGISITASHNEYTDNGIKIFAEGGLKLPDDAETIIENYMERTMEIVPSAQMGKAYKVEESRGRYIEFCKNSIPLGLPFHHLKMVVDCANGATYAVAPNVFKELGAQVMVTGAEPNGCNINAGCGSTHTSSLQIKVKESHADLGIAFDGDGDRIALVDKFGREINGDLILYAIAKYRLFKGEKIKAVVGTIMTNLGIEQAFKRLGIDFYRAKVGDRYVLEKLKEIGGMLGGESSGHIICLDRNSTGDGIVAGLQVVAGMLEMQKALHEIIADVTIVPQVEGDMKVKNRKVLETPDIQAPLEALREEINDFGGRLVLRASGTEPKIRIMIESEDKIRAQEIIGKIQQLIKEYDDA